MEKIDEILKAMDKEINSIDDDGTCLACIHMVCPDLAFYKANKLFYCQMNDMVVNKDKLDTVTCTKFERVEHEDY